MASRRPTLFHGGVVHTVEAQRPKASWFTVLGDRIQRVGSGPPPEVARRVDLGGRCVVPGFVDSHIHFFQTGIDALQIDLSGCASHAEVAERLVDLAPKGPRSTVYANSFEEDALDDRRPLTREDLDAIHPRRPVWVNRVDYHSAVVNSVALQRLGVPNNLRGLMKGDDGKPNGILRGEAYMFAKTRVSRTYSVEMKNRAIKAAVGLLVPRGITAVHALEGGDLFGDEGFQALLGQMDRLAVDVTLFLQRKNPVYAQRLGFRHLGGCILIDGSLGSYTAALADPYDNHGRQRGNLYESKRSLTPFVRAAHEAGAQLAFHAIGERAIDVVLDVYEAALQREPRYDHRHRIEHFELATDAQIARAAELGVAVAMQPAFEAHWGGPEGMYASRIGERWRRTNRLRTIRHAGIRVAGGSDANVTAPDPIFGIHAAVHHPNPDERLEVPEALQMMTLDAAWAGFNEDRHGSIAPGKEASFAVLDRDLLQVPPSELKDVQVVETWSRGKRVFTSDEAPPKG